MPWSDGLPSSVRGTGREAASPAASEVRTRAVVPATVIVSVLVNAWPSGPPATFNVYVVVADGVTFAEARVITGPISGVISIAPGFSAAQLRMTDSPGLMEVLSAEKSTIRAVGQGNCGGRLQPRVVCAKVCA